MTGLQNAAKQYSIKIALVFHAHATKHLLQALERLKKKGKEGGKVRKEKALFSTSEATQRICVCVSLGYLFCIMISDISENMKCICEPKTKSKMALENDSL